MCGEAAANSTQLDTSEPEEECASLVFTHFRKSALASSSAQMRRGGGCREPADGEARLSCLRKCLHSQHLLSIIIIVLDGRLKQWIDS